MTIQLPKLRHAALSHPGKKRLANEDAYAIDARTGLFVVCDGIGGRPSGEAASQIVAYSLAHALRRRVRAVDRLDSEIIKKFLASSIVEMNEQLHEHATAIPTLEGMGCTLVAALFDARMAFLVYAGDSRAYLLRGGKLIQLTKDHVSTDTKLKECETTGEMVDVGERRLLVRYVGMSRPVKPTVGTLKLEPFDRLLLCSDGLTDPVDDETIRTLLKVHDDPNLCAKELIDTANAAGGPDNITCAVIDYEGARPMTDKDREKPPRSPQELPHGVAERTLSALKLLEQDLTWLQEGARESAHPVRLTALAAAKRRLGKDTYRDFLNRSPSHAPSHVFHQACTHPDAPWRAAYSEHLAQLENPLTKLTGGGIRLSPLLSSDETARIYRDLWRGWRRVEQRYFVTCQRDAIHESEATLDILINHMLASVQTLAGLLKFLPRYMR
jgi:protein phosphatase